MKIIYVVGGLIYKTGTFATVHFENLKSAWDKEGLKVEGLFGALAAGEKKPRDVNFLLEKPVPKEDIRVLRYWQLLRYRNYCKSLQTYWKKKGKEYNLVIERWWPLGGTFSFLARKSRVPVIVFLPPSVIKNKLVDWLSNVRLKKLAQLVQAFVVNDLCSKELLLKWKIKRENIYFLPPPCNLNTFKPFSQELVRKELSLPPDKKILLYGGVLNYFHQLMPMVKAFCKVNPKDTLLIIIGEGDKKKDILSIFKKSKVNNYLFKSTLSQSDYSKYISACDLGLAPYNNKLKKISALKIGEYMAMERAVVTTRSAGEELISDGENGFLLTANNLEEWEKFFLTLPSRKYLLEMGKGNRLKVANFNTTEVANKFINIIKNLLNCS